MTIGPIRGQPEPLRSAREETTLAEIARCIDEEQIDRACSEVLLYALEITPETPMPLILEVYAILDRLIPKASEGDLKELAAYSKGSLLYKLFLFDDLAEQQWELALCLGKAFYDLDSLSEAMIYYAICIDLAIENFPDRVKKAHQLASQTFFRHIVLRCIDLEKYDSQYSVSQNHGDEAFLEAIKRADTQVQVLQKFACDERDYKSPLCILETAKTVLRKLPFDKRDGYSRSYKFIQETLQRPFSTATSPITENLRNALGEYRQIYRKRFQDLQSSPEAIRAFQRDMFLSFQAFMQTNFLNPLVEILDDVSFPFTFLAMGSIAREELCPFSDLEWIATLDDPSHRNRLIPFIELLELLVLSLRETSKGRTFTSLCTPEQSGLHLDNAADKKGLVEPSLPTHIDNVNELHPNTPENTMCRVSSIFHHGVDLIDRYQDRIRNFLDEIPPCSSKPRRVRHSEMLFVERIDDYRKLPTHPLEDAQIDIKKQFTEPLFHLIGDLALYHSIEKTNTLDIIDALEGIAFNKECCTLLRRAVAQIYHIRVRLHLAYGHQKETVFVKPHSNHLFLTAEEREVLMQTHLLLLQPLYHHLGEWMEGQRNTPPFQNADLPDQAFMVQMASFATEPNLQQANAFVCAFKAHLANLPDHSLQNYYKLLSTDTRLEPMRELFVTGLPQDSPLLSIPNRDGFRQSFRVEYAKLDRMLNAMTQDAPPTAGLVVKVVGLIDSEVKYLRSDVVSQVMSQHWHILKYYQNSAHNVSPAEGEGFSVHLKEMPSQPMMEYAIHSFTSRLIGEGTPPSRLLRFEVSQGNRRMAYPVLASMTIQGRLLSTQSSRETEPSAQDSTTDLSRIQPQSITWMCIRALLIRPGDERASNFIVDEEGVLHCFDNDVAFVEPIRKMGWIQSKVFFKSILFLLGEKPLDQGTIAKFLKIPPDLLLHRWLEDIAQMERRMIELFPREERRQLHHGDKEMNFTPFFLINVGSIATLYTQFLYLQEFLRKHPSPVLPVQLLKGFITLEGTHLQLSEVGEKLYRCYQRVTSLRASQQAKLQQVVQEKTDRSLTTYEAMRAAYGRVPSFQEIEQRNRLTPLKALEELTQCYFQIFNNVLQISTRENEGRADFAKITVGSQPDIERQRLILRALQSHHTMRSHRSITLMNAFALTDEMFLPFLHENLRNITLVNCVNLSTSAIRAIATRCTHLESLTLEKCPKALGEETTQTLRITYSSQRKKVFFEHTGLLRSSDITSFIIENLTHIDFQYAPNIDHRTLELIAARCQDLQSLTMQHCPNVTKDNSDHTLVVHFEEALSKLRLENFGRVPSTLLLQFVYAKDRHIHFVNCPSLPHSALVEIAKRCPQIETLCVGPMQPGPGDDPSQNTRIAFTQQRTVVKFENLGPLRSSDIEPFLHPGLTELIFQDAPHLDQKALEIVLKCCPALQKLTMEHCPNVSKLSREQTLSIRYEENRTKLTLENFGNVSSSLLLLFVDDQCRFIEILNTHRSSLSAIAEIARRCTNLQRLYVNDYPTERGEDEVAEWPLGLMARTVHNLSFNDNRTELSLHQLPMVTKEILTPLLSREIRKIRIQRFIRLQGDVLQLLAEGCPELRILEIDVCIGFKEFSASGLFPKPLVFPRLTTLHLSRCTSMELVHLEADNLKTLTLESNPKLRVVHISNPFVDIKHEGNALYRPESTVDEAKKACGIEDFPKSQPKELLQLLEDLIRQCCAKGGVPWDGSTPRLKSLNPTNLLRKFHQNQMEGLKEELLLEIREIPELNPDFANQFIAQCNEQLTALKGVIENNIPEALMVVSGAPVPRPKKFDQQIEISGAKNAWEPMSMDHAEKLLTHLEQSPILRKQTFDHFIKKYAFGAFEWKECFGIDVKEPPIPFELLKTLYSPSQIGIFGFGQPVSPRYTYQSHCLVLIPGSIRGEPISTQSLSKLTSKYHDGTRMEAHFCEPPLAHTREAPQSFGVCHEMPSPYWALVCCGDIAGYRTTLKLHETVETLKREYTLPSPLEIFITLRCLRLEKFFPKNDGFPSPVKLRILELLRGSEDLDCYIRCKLKHSDEQAYLRIVHIPGSGKIKFDINNNYRDYDHRVSFYIRRF